MASLHLRLKLFFNLTLTLLRVLQLCATQIGTHQRQLGKALSEVKRWSLTKASEISLHIAKVEEFGYLTVHSVCYTRSPYTIHSITVANYVAA